MSYSGDAYRLSAEVVNTIYLGKQQVSVLVTQDMVPLKCGYLSEIPKISHWAIRGCTSTLYLGFYISFRLVWNESVQS